MNEKNIFGMLDSDGAIASWPEADLNGAAVIRANATRAQVDSTRFVVLPVNMEFTEELKAALQGGYNGLEEWRGRTVLAPVVGFTQVDDDGNPVLPEITFNIPQVETFSVPSPAPLNEAFSKRNKVGLDDNS